MSAMSLSNKICPTRLNITNRECDMNGVRRQVKAGIISAGWMPPGATKAALTRLRSKRESFDAQRGSMQKRMRGGGGGG